MTGVELARGVGRRRRAPGGRRRRLQRRPARRLPHPARRGRRAPGRPPRPLLAVLRAVARRRHGRCPARHRPPQHPLRHASGTSAFAALIDDGTRMPDPSILVTVPSLDDPSLAPAGCSTHVRARAGAQPRRSRRLEPGAGTGADRPRRSGGRARLPDRRRRRARRRPARLGGAGHGAGHAVRAWPTRSSRPVRSGPRNVDRRVPGLVFVGSGTVPGVGVPMVLVSGRLAAERVERFAAEGR